MVHAGGAFLWVQEEYGGTREGEDATVWNFFFLKSQFNQVMSANGDIQHISRKISVTIESGWDDGTELRFPKEQSDLTGKPDLIFLCFFPHCVLLGR